MSQQQMKQLHIELNVTKQCNMRCAYCTEIGQYESLNAEKIVPDFISFIDRILASDYFKSNYNSLVIAFWGGEPTLKNSVVIDIITKYKTVKEVGFLLYTNGLKMPDSLAELIVSIKNEKVPSGMPKFFTQISYDGQPIHDLKRTSVVGKPTAETVKNTILWAKYNKIPFSVKSTITMDTLKYMHEAYLDVNNLVGNIGSDYFPTLDYFNENPIDSNFLEYLEDMKLNLKKIASTIITKKREGKNAMAFKWFTGNKANCSAGVNLFSVDIDGNIYVCHGCLYTDAKDDHFVGTLNDDASILEAAAVKHNSSLNLEPEECKSCEALFCVRCNTVRYSVSTKETYSERWKDYTNNPGLCTVYKEVGLIARAFQKINTSL